MKKQTLLGAAALTTLAIAGTAHAGTLSPANVTGASVTKNHVIATEVTLGAAASKGVVGLALTPTKSAILPSGNSLLKVSLTGGAKFGEAVTAGAVVANAGATATPCAPTTVISTGGAAGDSSVTFLVSNLSGCTNDTPIHLAIPVELTGASAVNVETFLSTEAGTAIDGGSATTFDAKGATPAAQNLISFGKAVSVEFTKGTGYVAGLNSAQPNNNFKSLTGTDLGTAQVKIAANVFNGINAGAAALAATDILAVKYTLTGGYSTVALSSKQGTAAAATIAETPAGGGKGSVNLVAGTNNAGFLESVNFTAAVTSPAKAVAASTYTVSADVTLAASFNSPSTFGPATIGSITRDGASYLIPWVASEATASATGSNTVIRISNIGAAKVSNVSAERVTSSTMAPTTGAVPLNLTIEPGRDVVITSGTLQAALGDFGRGDIRLSAETQTENLVVRRFVQRPDGHLSEVSLGRDSNGNEPQN